MTTVAISKTDTIAHTTSKTPCLAMNERARKSYVWLFRCAFRNRDQRFPRQQNWKRTCEGAVTRTSDFCKPRNTWVSSHTSSFSAIGQSVPEKRRWGVHVCMCRDAQPKACIKTWLLGPQPPTTHQSSAQFAQRFPRYGRHVRTCARADAPHP